MTAIVHERSASVYTCLQTQVWSSFGKFSRLRAMMLMVCREVER